MRKVEVTDARWWAGVRLDALLSQNVEWVHADGDVESRHLKVMEGTAGGCAGVKVMRAVGERWYMASSTVEVGRQTVDAVTKHNR